MGRGRGRKMVRESDEGIESKRKIRISKKCRSRRRAKMSMNNDCGGTGLGGTAGETCYPAGSNNAVVLSAAQRQASPYKRVQHCANSCGGAPPPWVPPPSCHHLLQEMHYYSHWRVLIICILLNQTDGRQVRNVLPRFFARCPDEKATAKVPLKDIERVIQCLGFHRRRARTIKRFTEQYLKPGWQHVTELYGIGKYAADAYAIFCSGRWKEVEPKDHKLVDYWKFLLENEDSGGSIITQGPFSMSASA